MQITCCECGKRIEVDDLIVPGQRVKCPYCEKKFVYAPVAADITEEDLRTALDECRKDPKKDEYYRNAPAGARLFIALVFYGIVFRERLSVKRYMQAFNELGPNLKETDLRYLLQHEDDDALREYLADRLCALGVPIDSGFVQAKTTKRPRVGIIRENPQQRSAQAEDIKKAPEVPLEYPGENTKARSKARYSTVVAVGMLVLAIAILVCVIAMRNWSGSEPCQVAAEVPVVKPIEREVAKPVAVPEAKSSAGNDERQKSGKADLVAYLERERIVLEKTAKESVSAYEEIVGDQLKLSKVLAGIEQENLRRDERAQTNGWIRFEKPEVVMMILKDKDLNALAMKYVGEDFSALCNECRGRIRSEMQLQAEHERLLSENRKKYQQAISGLDEDVERKNAKARAMRNETNRMFGRRIIALKSKLSNKETALRDLKARGSMNKSVLDDINVLQAEIIELKNEISKMEEIASGGEASSAHITATEAENVARRKGDTALSVRQDEDNAVQVKMDHIRSLFTISVTFEERSLDRLRAAMQSRKELLNTRLADANSRLEVVNHALANTDMLSAEQVSDIKRKIGVRIGENVLNERK